MIEALKVQVCQGSLNKWVLYTSQSVHGHNHCTRSINQTEKRLWRFPQIESYQNTRQIPRSSNIDYTIVVQVTSIFTNLDPVNLIITHQWLRKTSPKKSLLPDPLNYKFASCFFMFLLMQGVRPCAIETHSPH